MQVTVHLSRSCHVQSIGQPQQVTERCHAPTCVMFSPFATHTLYPGCNIFVYIADQKQPDTSRARMDCGKLTLFLLLETLKRGVASQDLAEKHSVPTFMFCHK